MSNCKILRRYETNKMADTISCDFGLDEGIRVCVILRDLLVYQILLNRAVGGDVNKIPK